jgi:hypothetical protein
MPLNGSIYVLVVAVAPKVPLVQYGRERNQDEENYAA